MSLNVVKDYLIKRLKELEFDKQSMYNKEEFRKFLNETGSNGKYKSYQRQIQQYFREYFMNEINNNEVISESLERLQAAKQGLQDRNAVVNKINRESNRLYNHLEALYTEYVSVMKEYGTDLKDCKLKSEKVDSSSGYGILHLSDLHSNMKIEAKEELDNEYNFTIMSKRLKKFVTEAIFYFKAKNIKNVCVVMTGDLISSDLRESQKLNRITNQVKASLLTSYILKQVLIELNQFFGLRVASVCGNESRLQDFMSSDEILCTSNYDFLIFNNLRLWLEDNTNIKFDIGGNYRERLLDINGFKVLLLHGDTLGQSRDIGKQLKNIMTKYAIKGVKINCVLSGHIHSCNISDIFSRSASLCGVDTFAGNELNLFDGRSSQNIYFINKDKSYDALKIDLKDTSDIDIGYNIKQELEQYYIKENFDYNNEVIIRNLV